MEKWKIEKFFCGIILLFIFDILCLLSLTGINFIDLFGKLPVILIIVVGIYIIVKFIPEKIYDFYEDYPVFFYVFYILEFVCLFPLIFVVHNKYYSG